MSDRNPSPAQAMRAYMADWRRRNPDYGRNWRSHNIDKVRAQSRASRRRTYRTNIGRARAMWNSASSRAGRLGVPFELTHDWIVERLENNRCAITGMPFSTEVGSPYVASIDRITPKLGYVPKNCRLIISAANLAKNRWSDDVLYEWAEALLTHREGGCSVVSDHED